jgi:acid phosphatase (class A)
VAASVCALAQGVTPGKPLQAAPKTHAGYYVDPATLTITPLLPAPPQEAAIVAAELAELHRIEHSRTPAQVAAAVADDKEEDIFSFRTVLGEWFRADRLPLTAALSVHVHGEEGAVSDGLKLAFARPRPYQADKSLHPVCKLTTANNSYPSGHTLSGYLLAFTLAEMLPEKKQQILDRADDYAHNRLICGVHYPSDLEASKRTAYVVFGSMMSNPNFLRDMQAARAELRSQPALVAALR